MIRFSRLVESTAQALVRHRAAILIVLSLAYFVGVCGKAMSRPFWFDEIFTWHLSQAPDLAALWQALLSNADSQPPLSFWLVRLSHALFGSGELATRVPNILSFWLAGACFFIFVRRHCRPLAALVGVLVFLHTAAYEYAYDARPYSHMLACCAFSMLCWQRATDGGRRWLPLVGLAAGLAVGLQMHYYSVLLFLPIAAGEACRTLRNRKVDWLIWVAIAAAAASLLFMLPHVRALSQYSDSFYSEVSPRAVVKMIRWLFGPLTYVAGYVALLLGAMLLMAKPTEAEDEASSAREPPPPHELTAVAVLALLPVLGWVLARCVTHAFENRYFVAAALGIAALASYAVCRALRWSRAPAVVLVLVLGGAFVARQAGQARGVVKGLPAWRAPEILQAAEPDETIVMAEPFIFLEAHHYAPEPLKSRMVYVADVEAAIRHNGLVVGDRSLLGLGQVADLPIVDYGALAATNNSFCTYGPAHLGWLLAQLAADGARITVVAQRGGVLLTRVTLDSD